MTEKITTVHLIARIPIIKMTLCTTRVTALYYNLLLLLWCVISLILSPPKENLAPSFCREIRECEVNHITVPLRAGNDSAASSRGEAQHFKCLHANVSILQISRGDAHIESHLQLQVKTMRLRLQTHVHTFPPSCSPRAYSSDNSNLHCICYNWPLSLEMECGEPLFPILWAVIVQRLRGNNSRLDLPINNIREAEKKGTQDLRKGAISGSAVNSLRCEVCKAERNMLIYNKQWILESNPDKMELKGQTQKNGYQLFARRCVNCHVNEATIHD